MKLLNTTNLTEIETFEEGVQQLEKYGVHYFLASLQANNIFNNPKEILSRSNIAKKLNALPKHIELINVLLDTLARHGLLNLKENDQYQLSQHTQVSIQNLTHHMGLIVQQRPSIQANAILLQKTMESYLSILSGKQSILPIMFPNGSFELIEKLYRDTPTASYYNRQVAKSAHDYAKTLRKPAAILEIGSGVGATSEAVLHILSKYDLCRSYCYTDISNAFIRHAERRFKNTYPFTSFQTLNIEKPPKDQDLINQQYDIIIATNVLHATRNLTESLKHVISLLKPHGLFILNEGIKKRDFSTLIYGLTDGWWRFEDKTWRIPGSPLVNTDNWQILLEQSGFKKVSSLNAHNNAKEPIFQDIFLAK